MADCDICKVMENKEAFHIIYEDEVCFALLHESPAVPGHTLVIPKKHATIVEELDDEIVSHIFVVCNKISTILFDKLGAQGTNLILNNGHDAGQELPHVVVHVLPRKEGDKLDFEWSAKQTTEPALSSMKNRIQIYADPIFLGKDELPVTKVEKPEEKKQDNPDEPGEDYLIKNLKRIP